MSQSSKSQKGRPRRKYSTGEIQSHLSLTSSITSSDDTLLEETLDTQTSTEYEHIKPSEKVCMIATQSIG